jgi:hypothetical protein
MALCLNKRRETSLSSGLDEIFSAISFSSSFLHLGATAQGQLWPPEQSTSILQPSEADYLVSEKMTFYGVRC